MAEAVKQLDTRVLCGADDARAMLACAPAAEERKMFEAFLRSGGDAAALSNAERFCLELMQVRVHLKRKAQMPQALAYSVLLYLLPQRPGWILLASCTLLRVSCLTRPGCPGTRHRGAPEHLRLHI